MSALQKNKLPRNFGQMMGLLEKKGLQGRRHAIVWQYSKGRTESSRELTFAEISAIIKDLKAGDIEGQASDVMRKKIISMAREMGWEVFCPIKEEPVADMTRIENWCIKYGYLHKGINKYLYNELPALVTQFETYYTGFLRAIIK